MHRTKSGRGIARTVEIAILLALPVFFHFLFPIMIIVPKPYKYLGIPLMVAGFALSTWAAKTFRKAGTSYQLHEGSSVLTTSGPFRFSRNPIYLAMIIWLIGLAVLMRSLTGFLFPIFLFLAANFLIIPPEERKMEKMFGEQYADYRRRVRRWL
jgi:protein-S-isoprenylcysteine O-methyltransferase Ste14